MPEVRFISLTRAKLFSKGRAPIWGEEIINCLLRQAHAQGVRFQSGLIVYDLRVEQGNTRAIAFAVDAKKWLTIVAKAAVLAAGGAGALYLRHDNPKRMLGDGYYLALKAGAVLQDMEFVQFYPLGPAEPGYPVERRSIFRFDSQAFRGTLWCKTSAGLGLDHYFADERFRRLTTKPGLP